MIGDAWAEEFMVELAAYLFSLEMIVCFESERQSFAVALIYFASEATYVHVRRTCFWQAGKRAEQDVRIGRIPTNSLIDRQYQQAEPPQGPTRRAGCVPRIKGLTSSHPIISSCSFL